MKYKEIELKYKADEIDLNKFKEYCLSQSPSKAIYAAGYDHFYDKAGETGTFCRHRQGADINQLTFKRKTTEKNSFIRTEHNIELAKHVDRAAIEALCSEFGYTYNTTIFKTCFVYEFKDHLLVYYIVADENLREVGRFLEIEMAEDYPWSSEEEAWAQLTLIEKLLKGVFGITPQARLRSSLFELYKNQS